MESEFLEMIREYAGKHGKTLFWLLFFAVLFSIFIIPLLTNLIDITENIEWFFAHFGITSFILKVVTAFLILSLSILALKLAAYVIAFCIRLAYATPIHYRIEKTLNETIMLLKDTEGDKQLLLDKAESLMEEWNRSHVTRLVRWILLDRRERLRGAR